MDLQRAKKILEEEADNYSDKEILEILDLFMGLEETIYKEYQKFQLKNWKKTKYKKKFTRNQ